MVLGFVSSLLACLASGVGALETEVEPVFAVEPLATDLAGGAGPSMLDPRDLLGQPQRVCEVAADLVREFRGLVAHVLEGPVPIHCRGLGLRMYLDSLLKMWKLEDLRYTDLDTGRNVALWTLIIFQFI